ncbi:MAG: CapA family protein [Myxococcota bacterium]
MIGAWLGLAAALAGDPLQDGVAALRGGELDHALSSLQRAVDADPTSVEAWWELGWARWMAGDFAGAAACWEKVSAADPTRPQVGLWLGAARERARYRAFDGAVEGNPPTPDDRTFTLVAGGDTMMGSDLRGELPPGDGAALFDGVRGVLSGADVAFLNLEGPLADGLPSDKCAPDSGSCYAFRTPTRFAQTLAGVGLDLASLANNHAFDVGEAGQTSTMRALDAVGIAHAGRYGDTALIEREGVKIALVGAHSGSCCLNVNHLDDVRAAVALADRDADVVVFSFHGGAEGAKARHVVPGTVEVAWGEARGDVTALAHAAIDAGADVVLGHGPHVLRAIEVYRGRLVAYSLGNFLGYQQFGAAGGYGRATVLLELELGGNGALRSARLHPFALSADAVPSPDPTGVALDHVRELSAADFPTTGVRVAADGTLTWEAR